MDSENTSWAVFKTTVGSWSYIEFDYPTVYIYVRIQNLQEVRWAHQLNYKIAHLQLSIINFVGVIILPTPIPLFFFSFIGFDYLGIPGTKNTIAKESTTHGMVFGNLPLLAECSREGSAQWLIP